MKQIILFSLFILTYANSKSQNYVETYSGSTGGLQNGNRLAAKYNNLAGLAIDKVGNIYLADVDNHCIRKMDTSGNVTTLAGAGIAGFQDGNASTARFNQPWGIAVDDSFNVFVSDFLNQRIRKISFLGIVSTLGGTGTAGLKDGKGDTALFNYPRGMCFDNLGNLYIADSWNHRIRKINQQGIVSTFAGNGVNIGVSSAGSRLDTTNALATFYTPTAITYDGNHFYVADAYNHAVRKIENGTKVKTIAGGQNSGPGNGDWQDGLPGTSFLNTVTELFYFKDSNYIIFSDLLNNSIRKIRLSDNYTSTLNASFDTGFVNGPITQAKFNHPRGIAQDKRGIFVNDGNNQKVRILFTKKSTEITQIQQRENQYCEDGKCIVTPSESKVFKGFQLFDLQGHVLIDNSETTTKIAFDKSVFPQGVYILKLNYEGNQYNLIKVYFGVE